jgi:hypothetical protein
MNCVGANLGTPISRLAHGKTPIGRLAFPGNIQSLEKCGLGSAEAFAAAGVKMNSVPASLTESDGVDVFK